MCLRVECSLEAVGYLGDRIVGVSMRHVYGDKAAGQALLDEYAEKVKGVVAALK